MELDFKKVNGVKQDVYGVRIVFSHGNAALETEHIIHDLTREEMIEKMLARDTMPTPGSYGGSEKLYVSWGEQLGINIEYDRVFGTGDRAYVSRIVGIYFDHVGNEFEVTLKR